MNCAMSKTAPPPRVSSVSADNIEIERLRDRIISLEMSASLQSVTTSVQQPPSMFTFTPSIKINTMNVTINNNTISSSSQVMEVEDDFEEADSIAMLDFDVDDVKLPRLKTPCTACKTANCKFLHQAQVNKFSADEIAALPAGRKEEYESKKNKRF